MLSSRQRICSREGSDPVCAFACILSRECLCLAAWLTPAANGEPDILVAPVGETARIQRRRNLPESGREPQTRAARAVTLGGLDSSSSSFSEIFVSESAHRWLQGSLSSRLPDSGWRFTFCGCACAARWWDVRAVCSVVP